MLSVTPFAAGGLLAGCNSTPQTSKDTSTRKKFKWKMVTTWPRNFPGLGTAANNLASIITKMSGNRLEIKIYGAGEIVPPLEIFDFISNGGAQMGHGGSYYWQGKNSATPFFCSVPFGMTAQEINAWLYYGGGLELWQKLYAPYNLIPFPSGNTGVQMAGWFNKKIDSIDDFKGLKMRIPGLGGEVLNRLGGSAVNVPGGELFTSLSSGVIDATEWVGPYNDLAFGFHKVAKYYYYPGWHEPGSVMEALINKQAYEELPDDLQAIVQYACQAINCDMLSELTAFNNKALKELIEKHNVSVLKLPDEVIQTLRTISKKVQKDLIKENPSASEIYQSFNTFKTEVSKWSEVSENQVYKWRKE